MRPIKLTMQAFGAYPDRVEIPFEKLGNLYLINGATGSGKTTIFDGICYALFDCASGSLREKDSFRSHFAKDDTKTFVEFSFLFNGEEYKILRTPSYLRKKLKGEGYREVPSCVEFYLPDRKIITKNDEVKKLINEILGINAEQFSQIALLAQGEFLKLLNSDTQTRSKIFRTIFKTQKYLDLASKLKDEFLSYKNKYNLDKNSILQYIAQISSEDIEINDLKNNYQKFGELNSFDEFILKIKNENSIDSKHYEAKNKKLSNIQKEFIEYNKILENIKTKQNLLENKEKFEKELSILGQQFLPIENEYKHLDEKNKQKDFLKTKINDLKSDIEKIEEIEIENEKFLILDKKKNKNAENFQKLNSKLLNLKNDFLKNSYLKILDTKETLSLKQKEFEDFKILVQNKKNEFDFLYNMYLSIQAGILAKDLKEDTPCPVCGSKIHPNPAKINDSDVSKEKLDKQKNELNFLQNNLADLSLECGKINSSLSNLKENFENLKTRFGIEFDENDIDFQNVKNIDYNKEIKKTEDELELNSSEKEKILFEVSSIISKIETLKKDIKTDTKTLKEEYKTTSDSLKILENNIKKTEENYNIFNTKIQKLKSNIELLNSQIDEQKNIDVNTFSVVEQKKNELEISLKNLQIELENISAKKSLNCDLIYKIEKKYNEFLQNEKMYKEYKVLSEMANGNMANKAKITFEQYIQGYYLDMVLYEANKHFKRMTNNRYILQRKTEIDNLVSKTALELDVMDFYTFKKRATKTLSGGESFKAALSLALGLSDCVANISGIINIDTLFIDEGFGTLDSESLELAINVISELSNSKRQIGIISHVEELKNRIQNQIVAIKTQNGSKLEIVY